MKAVSRHIYAITKMIELLAKGKFLGYFIPSVIIGGVFAYYIYQIDAAAEPVNDAKGWLSSIWSKISGTSLSIFSGLLSGISTFILLTLLSPVNALLSEKLDNELTDQKFDGGIGRVITDIFRAMGILGITLIFQIIFSLAWTIIAWILNFHKLDSLIYFVINAFFFGFSFYDFSLERYQFSVMGSWRAGMDNKLHMFLTGLIFSSIMLIPYIGIIFAPIITTIIATIVFLKMNEQKPGKPSDPSPIETPKVNGNPDTNIQIQP